MTHLATPLRLHGWCTSPFTQKVLLALTHKRASYEWLPAPLIDRSDLARHTGSNKVPALEAGKHWITDSTAIIGWLDENVEGPSLYPADTSLRQLCRLIEDWADETLCFHAHAAYWCPRGNAKRILDPAVAEHHSVGTRVGAWMFARTAPGMFRKLATLRRSEAASRALLGEQLDMLEGLLDRHPYLVGEQPTAADFAAAGQLLNLADLEGEAHFGTRGRLRAWLTSVAQQLPARFRVPALPVALLPPAHTNRLLGS